MALKTATLERSLNKLAGEAGLDRPYDEVSVFRAAAAYERARPWLDSAERRPPL